MIEEHAIILSTESQSTENQGEHQSIATLEVVRKTACGLCGKTRGCGNALWGKIFAHKAVDFKAENSIDAKVGQSVIVGIDEHALMKSALLLYMVPLASMLLGAVLLSQVSSSDLVAMLGAIIGLVVGYLWVRAHTAGHTYYQSNQPKILRLDNAACEEHAVKFQ